MSDSDAAGDPSAGAPTIHTPVLLAEVLEWLAPAPGARIIDATLGGGGHAALAEAVGPSGLVLAVDRDLGAVERAARRLPQPPCQLVHGNYRDLPEILRTLDIAAGFDALVADLGLSSDQLADRERGFSFDSEGELDLRFDTTLGEPAWRMIHRLSEKHLADLIYQLGEERFSRRIARKIVQRREQRDPVRESRDLAQLVRSCIPAQSRQNSRIHPATRTFQALRIAVNDELGALETLLRRLPELLRPGGRAALISFHSLEDRRVKQAFREDDAYDVLTRKPILPTESEIAANPRSRSARMRVASLLQVR